MKITAPFSPEAVDALNRWQTCGRAHPFTCGSGARMNAAHAAYQREHGGDFGQLVATPRRLGLPGLRLPAGLGARLHGH